MPGPLARRWTRWGDWHLPVLDQQVAGSDLAHTPLGRTIEGPSAGLAEMAPTAEQVLEQSSADCTGSSLG